MNRNFDQFVTKATSLIKKFGSADFYQWAFSLLVEQITCINAIMLYLYDDKKIFYKWNMLSVLNATFVGYIRSIPPRGSAVKFFLQAKASSYWTSIN